MQETGIKLAVIQEICELAQKHQIEKVILFGSRARGDYKRASDIDLAVKGGNISRFALDVEEETSTKFDNYITHLRVLERADQEKLDNEFIISGIIDKFSIQFELGWKMLKELF